MTVDEVSVSPAEYKTVLFLQMKEVLGYLRDNGFRTYIVTGGGQDFVRVYAEATYGIPPEQVVGTAGSTTYSYGKDGKPILTKEPKLLLNDNNAGKPEGIHLMIGRRPVFAAGNSTGDQEMLEYTEAGERGRGSKCWSCTMTPSGNTPTAPPPACRTPRSGPSRRISMTRRSRTAGSSSA